MSAQVAASRMTVEEFLDWADAREDDGHYELDDGFVVAMAPKRVVHPRIKGDIYLAVRAALERSGLPCEALVEGPGLRVDAHTSYQPDVVVDCGARLPDDARFVGRPVIVIEILSPSTAGRDLGRKSRGYFRVPSIAHYLIVDPDDRVVTHRWRGDGGIILSEDLDTGELILDPPGLTIAIAALLPAAEAQG